MYFLIIKNYYKVKVLGYKSPKREGCVFKAMLPNMQRYENSTGPSDTKLCNI